jgi:hypothetical protein
MNFEDFKKRYQKLIVSEKSVAKKELPLVSVCIQTYNHVPSFGNFFLDIKSTIE